MATKSEIRHEKGERQLVASRIINAPRELVFRVWTDPNHIGRWWGPNGFTNTVHEMEVRPGGKWRFIMHGPDGTDFPNRIEYKEVVKNEKLVFMHGSDEDNDPNLFNVVVLFEAVGGKTKITMTMEFATTEERDRVVNEYGAIEGNNQTMNKLEDYLGAWPISLSEPEELLITRRFNAPRELVFKAWTEPAHLMKWWGPVGFGMQVAEMDLRDGGMFLYGMLSSNGTEMWGKFVYREVQEPERLVYIVSFTDMKGNPLRHPASATWPLEVQNVLTFKEDGEGTILEMRGRPLNATFEECATFTGGFDGMQHGFKGTLDQLETYLSNL